MQALTASGRDLASRSVNLAGCIVVNDAGDVLLIHRNANGTKQWEIPGGKVEDLEEASSAAIRELHEETGLEADVARLLGEREFVERPYNYLYQWFLVRVTGGTLAVREPRLFDGLQYQSVETMQQHAIRGELSPNASNFLTAVVTGQITLGG
jgi:mutator protein MutT